MILKKRKNNKKKGLYLDQHGQMRNISGGMSVRLGPEKNLSLHKDNSSCASNRLSQVAVEVLKVGETNCCVLGNLCEQGESGI